MRQIIKRNLFIILIIIAIIITIFMTRNPKTIDDTVTNSSELSHNEDNTDLKLASEAPNDFDVEKENFIVDVKGEVKHPGVYTTNNTTRVNDVIMLAGGFTGDADQNQINLAQKVHDEMVIYIPKIGELSEGIASIETPAGNQISGIQINVATQEEIQTLKGIGPSKAEAIITYREENGPFQSVEEILNVTGIGEKTLEKFKEDVIIP